MPNPRVGMKDSFPACLGIFSCTGSVSIITRIINQENVFAT